MDNWIPVLGTLAGGILGAGVTWLIERDRRKYERESRWLADRRTLYANVLRTADAYTDAILERARQLDRVFAGTMGSDQVTSPPDDDDFERAYHEAELLVASDTAPALTLLRTSTLHFTLFLYPDEDGSVPLPKIDKAKNEYREARERFVGAARRDLDVAARRTPAAEAKASVADLVEERVVSSLATSQARALGTELADAGKVRLDGLDPFRVSAAVLDAREERVELGSTSGALEWSCTCPDGRTGTFCRHVVAAAVETSRRAPGQRMGPVSEGSLPAQPARRGDTS